MIPCEAEVVGGLPDALTLAVGAGDVTVEDILSGKIGGHSSVRISTARLSTSS